MQSNNICVGLLAHVDAGKTTLAESLLYLSGRIRTLGRVDHKDAYLDTDAIERERGITIFSKQAGINIAGLDVTLIDTPGHVDFSAEMERTLQILDYGIIIISGSEGIQSHVYTLWKLLKMYNIPVFIFVNKMDMDGTDVVSLMDSIKSELDDGCIHFSENTDESFYEDIAVRDERVLDSYFENGMVDESDIARLISERKVFPCFFGSALTLDGVEFFMNNLSRYMIKKEYGDAFGARVYKITRDAKGERLTHIKVTGGEIVPKQIIGEEKVNQIRIYNGDGYDAVNCVKAGAVCVVTGLMNTVTGGTLGAETGTFMPVLEPVLEYKLIFPKGVNVHEAYKSLGKLNEEEPELNIVWDEELDEICVKVMGDIQIEILKRIIREKYDMEVSFGQGSIVYKETITDSVYGVGHYEPLRHYAEVVLLLSPGEVGSGVQYDNISNQDKLATNWQRLILTHLEEKSHRGVLVGGQLTDVKITLVGGKAHLKHTEGGDFRQATYRAVRHGLMKAESLILEPVYEYELLVPSDCIGRAMTDIQNMHGTCELGNMKGDKAIISGRAPVACMRGYSSVVAAYTKGNGRLTCSPGGYEPCHNQEEVIRKSGYDPVCDLSNPPGSVFCSHGAGYYVGWEQVEEYMHLEISDNTENEGEEYQSEYLGTGVKRGGVSYYQEPETVQAMSVHGFADKTLEDIFVKTYGPITHKSSGHVQRDIYYGEEEKKGPSGGDPKYHKDKKLPAKKDEYLLVDGYNIIFAWTELRELSEHDIDAARVRLLDILCNYQGYKKMTLIVVFDAYRVKGGQGSIMRYNNIHVVYTKEAETADQYIEKTVHKIGKEHNVTVATSDALEQIIIFGQGAIRMSAMNLLEDVKMVEKQIREHITNTL
ncbi:MAG: GTP-binding protein [Lachnospiraceae bacterium]|nr:GTP-binding protein [Lachnospiraceae bacterium]